MLSEREALKARFLAEANLSHARRELLAGDASTRRYERLHLPSGGALIFMDQPPSVETQPCPPDATDAERAALGYNALARLAAGRVEAFVACAGYLRGRGFSAPQVLVHDDAAGLAVLEDLGDDLYATMIAAGAQEGQLYDAAVDTLTAVHAERPPEMLTFDDATWPLLSYDDLALRTAGDLFVEWLPRLTPVLAFDQAALADWEAIWAPIRRRGAAGATVFCLRDYHAENLVWLPDRIGPARVGLLDFQDALRAHPAWDLSMLLHDARRDVSPERETACLGRYIDAHPVLDPEQFVADYHALGALNVARILGIFSRLIVRDGKPRYRAFMPRLWRYLASCASDPSLQALSQWLDRHVPVRERT